MLKKQILIINKNLNNISLLETSKLFLFRGFFSLFLVVLFAPRISFSRDLKNNTNDFLKTNSIKLNTLNLLLKYPSLSYERRVSYRGSMNIAMYGHDVVFITRTIGVGNILGYRFYAFQKETDAYLNSWYLNTGIQSYLNLNNYNDSGYNLRNKFQIGPFLGAGYQYHFNNNFLIDAGAHVSILKGISFMPGVYFSIGYSFARQ